MPSLFNVVRTAVYGSIFIATLICLAMAAHFESVLAASDLTRFVPFAIFVSTAALLIILSLLGFSLFLKQRNPISTRIELACLGLMGTFWLALGVFLATSESQSADVECFASETSTVVLDDSTADFQTEQYQAMYRVLMAFSLINAALVIFAFFALLTLAMRCHLNGDYHMWYGPVTAGMLNNYSTKPTRRGKASKSSILPTITTEKRSAPSKHKPSHSSSRRAYPKPHPVADRFTRQGGSGQSSLIGSNEFDNGGMVNPNRRPSR
ncbi:hypothetical protein B0H10DRAFT_1917292 [Mycena sp. CBHHK59/15]|nr:hypothetical protein B0H10DRAFT_1917292 [Mycena sp. CBHHK59/15]